jgi:adenylosuccinate lyase
MERLWTEEEKFRTWLEVEIAVCEAWARRGKIPQESLETIRGKAGFTVERILEIEAEVRHDVIAFLTCVGEHVGPDSRYIHIGLTSSDIGDTAQALRLVRAADLLLADVDALLEALRRKALRYKKTPMIGRTHGIHAEPTTLGLRFLLWYKEMERNRERLERAKETVRVGKISGAVGTFAHTGPEIETEVCEALGLQPAPVSTQVIQRDRYAEYVTTLVVVGSSLDKFATDIRSHQRTDLRELREPFGEKQKGSSAMPHKRNPVVCEQIAGLSRILRGNAVAALENVALWHERDISHSSAERVILADSTILLDYLLSKMTWVIDGLFVDEKRLRENIDATQGLIYSQKVLLALVDKGMPRDEAYEIVQRNAMKTWDEGVPFATNLLGDKEFAKRISQDELSGILQPESYLAYVDDIFARCGVS